LVGAHSAMRLKQDQCMALCRKPRNETSAIEIRPASEIVIDDERKRTFAFPQPRHKTRRVVSRQEQRAAHRRGLAEYDPPLPLTKKTRAVC
jgi:hypothetical protein